MTNKTVVVTGIGAISPLAATAPETWDALLAGKSGITRIEDERLVRGLGRYVDDIDPPRLAHVAFARCPYPCARIASIDASQRYNGAVGQLPELDRFLRRNPLCKLVPALDPGNSLVTRIARDEMAKRQPFAARMEKLAMEADGGGGEAGDGRRDLLDSLIQGHLKPGSGFSEMDVFSVAHGAM